MAVILWDGGLANYPADAGCLFEPVHAAGRTCRAFHISEDVFAGYNHTLRGGKTKFKEVVPW